jgi:hypothetical protein
MSEPKLVKPLGQRAYGSIPHMSGSRKGPFDIGLHAGQERICTEKARKGDAVYVTAKLDGSNVAVAKHKGQILAITRAGYLASETHYAQHHFFAQWVKACEHHFDTLLNEGERLCGEWLALAHGTIYATPIEPFYAFDLFDSNNKRIPTITMLDRLGDRPINNVPFLSLYDPLPITEALSRLDRYTWMTPAVVAPDTHEGVVYRVERYDRLGKFLGTDILAKYVKADKVDGKYLPEVSGNSGIWLWTPTQEVREANAR